MIKTIGIVGFTGGDNFGDVLMLGLYCRAIMSFGHKPLIVNGTRALHKRLLDDGIDVSSVGVAELKGSVVAVIFIGGGYLGWPDVMAPFWQYRFRTNNPYYLIARECRRSSIPYFIEGVEVGPGLWPLAIKPIRYILDNAESVVVRNLDSAKVVSRISKTPTCVTNDVLLGNLSVYREGPYVGCLTSRTGSVAGVHLSSHILGSHFVAKKFIDAIAGSLAAVRWHHIVLFADNPHGVKHQRSIEEIRLALAANGHDVEVREYAGPGRTIETIASIDFLITAKLHCGVIALSLGKYVVCIGSAPKLRRFYRQVGFSGNYLNGIFRTGRTIAKFIKSHIDEYQRNPVLSIGYELKQDSLVYMSNLNTIIDRDALLCKPPSSE